MLSAFRRTAAAAAATAPVLAALVALAPAAHAAVPGVRVDDLRLTESNAAQTRAVAIRLTAAPAGTVTVNVSSASVSASAPADYNAVPRTTVTFLRGQTVKTVNVTVKGDTTDEFDETFRLVLSSPRGITLSKSVGTVTIVDEDAPPRVMLTQAVIAETSGGPFEKAVNVSLSAPSAKPVSVAWETSPGTAQPGHDYEPAGGSVAIPAGTVSRPVLLGIEGDTVDEPDEGFYLRLAPTNATLTVMYHRVTLLDDDGPRTPVLDAILPSLGTSPYVSVYGAADGDTTARVYALPACAGDVVATGVASRLGSGGITVPVPPNATTSFSVNTLSSRGETSACSNAVAYTHDTIAPVPVVLATAPASPANDNAPEVTGTAEPGSTVLLYAGDACAGTPLATLTAAQLASPGATVNVADNTSSTYSATARDAAGNVSACAAGAPYVEDSIAPGSATVTLPDEGVGNPLLTGTVEDGVVVDVYRAGFDQARSCIEVLVAGVTPAQLAAGVLVPVTRKAATFLRVVSRDAAGNAQTCASAPLESYVDYTTETEPNGTTATAEAVDALNNPVVRYGEVGEQTDVDMHRVVVAETRTTLTVETSDPPNARLTCASNKLDTRINLYDAAGTQIGTDDDAGLGFCSRLVRSDLVPGTYYVGVTHSAFAQSSLFPLAYAVTINLATPTTVFEAAEPNGDVAGATALGTYVSGTGWDGAGSLESPEDVDVWSFTITTTRAVVLETVDHGEGICAGNELDTLLTLQSSGGQEIAADEDSGGGKCSRIQATLAAGTYYVTVKHSPLASPGMVWLPYRLAVRP